MKTEADSCAGSGSGDVARGVAGKRQVAQGAHGGNEKKQVATAAELGFGGGGGPRGKAEAALPVAAAAAVAGQARVPRACPPAASRRQEARSTAAAARQPISPARSVSRLAHTTTAVLLVAGARPAELWRIRMLCPCRLPRQTWW